MFRTLVVHYSRTGRTEQVARRIASAMDADEETIMDDTYRLGVLGYMRCAYEAMRDKCAPIDVPRYDPAHYDLVIVGSPVWGSALSSPVRSYLHRQGPCIKTLAVFCTEGGRGGEHVLKQTSLVAGKVAVRGLILRDSEIDERAGAVKLQAFLDGLVRPGVVIAHAEEPSKLPISESRRVVERAVAAPRSTASSP